MFSEYMRSKHRPIQVDDNSVRTMLDTGYGCVPDTCREILEMPITAEELKAAMFRETSKIVPADMV